jgi:hypothetical protein
MKNQYWIFDSSDAGETGLYYNDQLIADWRELRRKGYDYIRLARWSQKALARVAAEFRN